MLKRWIRYLPYFLVLRIARKHCGNFHLPKGSGLTGYKVASPFRDELIAWKEPHQ